jgi:hypothetical protein
MSFDAASLAKLSTDAILRAFRLEATSVGHDAATVSGFNRGVGNDDAPPHVDGVNVVLISSDNNPLKG